MWAPRRRARRSCRQSCSTTSTCSATRVCSSLAGRGSTTDSPPPDCAKDRRDGAGRHGADWLPRWRTGRARSSSATSGSPWRRPRPRREALSDLADAEVVLIFTARDLVEQVPAAWQETLKLGESSSLQNFIKALDVDEGRWRWSVLDPAEALPKWGAGLPADHIHVVTSPPKRSGDSPLWARFASVCGIDPQSCETDLGQSRESLGVESARLLQLIGPDLRTAVHADEPGQWKQAYEWIQRVLSHELLVPLGGNRIGLDERDLADIRERSAQSVKRLADAGYNVVGSLDDLVSAAVVDTGRAPEDVSDTELLALTLKLVPGLLGRLRDATRAAGPQPPEPPGERNL